MADKEKDHYKTNRIYLSVDTTDSDLFRAGHRFLDMHKAKRLADGIKVVTEVTTEDNERVLTLFVPSEKLEAMVNLLRTHNVRFGMLDVYEPEALALAEKLDLDNGWEDFTGNRGTAGPDEFDRTGESGPGR